MDAHSVIIDPQLPDVSGFQKHLLDDFGAGIGDLRLMDEAFSGVSECPPTYSYHSDDEGNEYEDWVCCISYL